jgi:hypothetical protein
MCRLVCWQEAASKAAQRRQSGSQEDATPTAAKKGKSEDGGDESDLQTATERGVQLLLTEGTAGPRDGIQVDCSWEHRGNRDTESRNSEGVNLSALRLLTRPSPDWKSVLIVSIY